MGKISASGAVRAMTSTPRVVAVQLIPGMAARRSRSAGSSVVSTVLELSDGGDTKIVGLQNVVEPEHHRLTEAGPRRPRR